MKYQLMSHLMLMCVAPGLMKVALLQPMITFHYPADASPLG